MTERERGSHEAPASERSAENGANSGATSKTRRADAQQVVADEESRERKREQARRDRKKRLEKARKLREEQEERARWEAMDTLWLTQVSSRAYGLIIGGFAVICFAVALVIAALGDTMGWGDNHRVIATTAFGA